MPESTHVGNGNRVGNRDGNRDGDVSPFAQIFVGRRRSRVRPAAGGFLITDMKLAVRR